MTDSEKIKEWAEKRLNDVESKISGMFGISERLYPDLVAKRVVLKDLIYFIDTMSQEVDALNVRDVIKVTRPSSRPLKQKEPDKTVAWLEAHSGKVVTKKLINEFINYMNYDKD